MKLFDSEWKVMEVLWQENDTGWRCTFNGVSAWDG